MSYDYHGSVNKISSPKGTSFKVFVMFFCFSYVVSSGINTLDTIALFTAEKDKQAIMLCLIKYFELTFLLIIWLKQK